MMLKRYVILFLLVLPISFGVAAWMKKPSLFPGDRLESRTCRECGGSGVEQGSEEGGPSAGGACIACKGKKQVPVVVPGPKHPSKVRGEVFDAKARPDESDVDSATLEMMGRSPADPVRGGVEGAHVVFTQAGVTVESTSNMKGRFFAILTPGEWKYVATASGFPEASGTVFVPLRTEPIWHEEAHIIRPDEEREGVPLPIALGR